MIVSQVITHGKMRNGSGEQLKDKGLKIQVA
jgi:hypothetical protein